MNDFTPRQREFQQRASALIEEYATAVGPAFDGNIDEGNPTDMPMCAGWLLISHWDDVADADNSSTVVIDSGTLNYPAKVGMLHIAIEIT